MSEPTIRAATIADAIAMADCVQAAYSPYTERMGGLQPGPMLNDYETEIRENDAYVLEQDGSLAGILVLKSDAPGFLLDNVAVRPEFQKRGLGRRLVGFAEECARRLGYDAVMLYTHVTMTENITFYESIGLTEIERTTVGAYQRVYMRKTLV